jgi:tRNA wybutosine-synthesizing protein 4
MVVNLGCGYDPLPFAYIAHGTTAMFVDIDFPDLIQHKQNMIQQTPELIDCVAGMPKEGSDGIQSKHYHLVGCDLTNLSSLDEKLWSLEPDLNNTNILFISEVAITYMVHYHNSTSDK